MRKGNYRVSLELLTLAQRIAAKNHWQKQLFLTKNYIGGNYFMLLDYGEALRNYREGYTIAIAEKDQTHELMALNNIAILYTKEEDFAKAREQFFKGYTISKEMNDPKKIGIYALNLGLVTNQMGNYPKSRDYLEEALQYAKNDTILEATAKSAIAENEMLRMHPEASLLLTAGLLRHFKTYKANEDAMALLLINAKSYLEKGDFNNAVKSAETVLSNSPNAETKLSTFKILSEIYAKSNSINEALRYKDSVLAMHTKLNNLKNGRLYENNRVKFEVQEFKNQIAVNKATIEAERRLFYWIIAALSIMVVLLFFIFRTINMRHKQKKLLAENNQQLLALELEKKKSQSLLLEKQLAEEQHQSLLEQQHLKEEIEYRNRQLSSKALYMSGKNQLIEDFTATLSQQPEAEKIPGLAKQIRTLKNSLRADNEWDNFLVHFEEVNHGFLTRLRTRHADLTSNDVRFICYVYMNLNAKETASMLNISLDACRKRKERVSSKLGLEDNTLLYSYLC
jgi:tetratricopeptide (TPR) repeat protein